jgi:antitoxin component of MazEF toxin-antitoxin module
MTYVRFKAKISKEGDRLVIFIPKALHEMISSVKGKEVLVHIEDAEEITTSGDG